MYICFKYYRSMNSRFGREHVEKYKTCENINFRLAVNCKNSSGMRRNVVFFSFFFFLKIKNRCAPL